jgi:hypothetical protein
MHIKASQPVRINCPPDLAWLCEGVYRTSLDPAAEPGSRDVWMTALVGRFGTVFPFGAGRLAVEVSDARIATRIAAALGNPAPYTRGWRFWCFTFATSQLGAVTQIICPPRVRRVTAVARKRLAAIGASTRFRAADTALNPSSEDQGTPGRPEAIPGPSDDPGHSGAPLTASSGGREDRQ